MMIFNSDGQPYFQDMYHDAGCYIGLTAKMCYSSPQAQQTVLDIFKKIADLGVTIVQFDQEDGGDRHLALRLLAFGLFATLCSTDFFPWKWLCFSAPS